MKNIKLIFYVLYGLMVLGTLYIAFDLDNLFARYGRLTFIDFLQGWIIATVIFMLAVVAVEQWHAGTLRNQIKKLEKEKEQLKSKLYDLESEFKENETKINKFQSSLKSTPSSEKPTVPEEKSLPRETQKKIAPRQNFSEESPQKDKTSKDKRGPEKRF